MKRRSITAAALSVLCVPLAGAQAPTEGRQFSTLRTRQRQREDGKIEVLEFFSYACPACHAFEPALERWTKSLASDVAFRRIPVPFLNNAQNFQRTFYALEATGMLAQAHGKVFDAVHLQKLKLSTAAEIADVVARAGGHRARFLEAFSTFSMSANLARGKAATEGHEIDSVPTLAIAGRFKTSPGQAGGAAGALAVADHLIDAARKAR